MNALQAQSTSQSQPQSSALPRRSRLGAVLIAVLIMLVALSRNAHSERTHLLQAELPNPDSYYNLVSVRDAQTPQGLQWIARDNAPYGSWLHWTLPYSWSLQQSVHLAQTLGLSPERALLIGGGALTLLSMLALCALIAAAVASVSSRAAVMVSGLVLATSVPLHAYGRVDQITHHIFMLLPVAAAALALLWRPQRGQSAVDFSAGLLLALALWTSPETMPFVVGLLGVRMAQRLQHHDTPPLWPITLGLVLLIVAAFAIDPPPPGFSRWALDRLSLAYVVLAALLALLLGLCDLSAMRRLPLRHSLPGLLLACLLAALLWLGMVPGVREGPEGLIPELLRRLWWSGINELQPARSAAEWIAWMALPLAGALLVAHAAWRERSLWLAALALLSLAYGGLGVWHTRMGAAAAVAASLALCIGLGRLRAFADQPEPHLPWRIQLGAFVLTILAPLQLGAYVGLELWQPDDGKAALDRQCSLRPYAAALQALPPSTVLTGVFSGPELLYYSHHRVLAGPYHHNVQGMLDNYQLWLSTGDGPAPALLAQRDVRYVLGCTHFQNELRAAPGAPHTLAQRVADGDVPAWLQPLPWPDGQAGRWRLYRVIDP